MAVSTGRPEVNALSQHAGGRATTLYIAMPGTRSFPIPMPAVPFPLPTTTRVEYDIRLPSALTFVTRLKGKTAEVQSGARGQGAVARGQWLGVRGSSQRSAQVSGQLSSKLGCRAGAGRRCLP